MEAGTVAEVDTGWDAPAVVAARGVLNDLLTDHMEGNRHAARRADGMRDVLDHARRHTEVYTDLPGDLGVRAAESAALLEIGLRLQLPETTIRNLAWAAETADLHLPRLWERARDGFAPFPLVEAAASAVTRLAPDVDADDRAKDASAAAIALVDEQTAEWVLSVTAATFRRRLRALVDRLDPRDASDRHVTAVADRRVVVDDAGDGMAWLSVLLPRIDAVTAKRRLTAAARHLQKASPDGRTRDQVRADVAAAWLRGDGTPTAAQAKVFVTIPVGLLTGGAADPTGRCVICGGTGLAEHARIVGDDALDDATAIGIFRAATAFRRVIWDPIRSVVVDLERHSRRASRAQRDWLTLQQQTCARDGCTRPALDADIDHILEWSRGGTTNLDDLRPLCSADHHRRHDTHTRYMTRPDGTVKIVTPTGYVSRKPPG